MNKKTILLLIPFAAAALAGCENANPTPPAPQCDSAIVTLDKQSITIEKNETYQLNATISVGNCPIQWASDNTAVATVANGLVTGVAKGTANISANGVVCVVTVTEEAPVVVKTLTKIEVTKNPTKTEYKVGETFDPAGLEVTASYSDTTSKVVDASCSAPDMSSEGIKTVTVTYTEGEVTQTASFTISVTKSEVTTITPAEAIALMDAAGDGVVVSGLQQVKGICAAGSTYDSQYKQYTTGFDGVSNFKVQFTDTGNILNGGSPDGMEIVVEGYLEKYQSKYQLSYLPESASPTGQKFTPNLISAQEVHHEGVLESITVSEAHREFYVGGAFVGETVTAHYSDGTTATVSASFSGYNMSAEGTQTVNVSYTEGDVTKTTSYSITVTQRTLTTITPAEAISLMDAAGDGVVVSGLKQVKGVCAAGSQYNSQYKQYTTGFDGVSNFKLQFTDTGNILNGGSPDGMEIVVEGYLEKYQGKYQLSYLPESASPTGQKFTPNLISAQEVHHEGVLESITVSEAHREFYVGGAFVGETVTAHYTDGTSANVTSSAEFSGYNMSVEDTQTVTVSYTEGEVTKTTTYNIVVNHKDPAVGGAVYTFTNSDDKALNMSDWDSAKFMEHVVVDGAEIITGMKGVTNAYIGGNGGSGDAVWNIWNCLKVGKSSAKGEITLLLDGTANFEKIKVSAIGARDDGTLTINNITKDVTKKATKTDLNPIELEYEIVGGVTELKLSSKDAASNNYGICITRIEFVGGDTPTPIKELSSISIEGVLAKTTYTEGEAYSAEGLSVVGHYSDGSSADVSAAIALDKTTATVGDTQIVASAEFNGKTATKDLAVTVNAKKIVTGITFSEEHRTFDQYAEFVKETVTATFTVGDPEIVEATFSTPDMTTAGEKTISVSYTDAYGTTVNNSYTITVVGAPEPELTGITIEGALEKTEYNVGEAYSAAGLSVVAHYNNGANNTVETTIALSKTVAAEGDTSITASATYEGKNASKDFAVTVVKEAVINSVTISKEADFAGGSYAANNLERFTTDGSGLAIESYQANLQGDSLQLQSGAGKIWTTSPINGGIKKIEFETTSTVLKVYVGNTLCPTSENGLELIGANGVYTVATGTYKYMSIINGDATTQITSDIVVSYEGTIGEYTIPAHEIQVSDAKVELTPGDTKNVVATVQPSTASDKSVKWSVKNASPTGCVTVSQDGTITAVAVGTATVVVSSVANPEILKEIAVTVSSSVVKADAEYLFETAASDSSTALDGNVLAEFGKGLTSTTNIVTAATSTKVYKGVNGLKFSSSSAKGTLTMTTNVAIKKLVIKAIVYGTDSAVILVNGKEVTPTGTLSDYEIQLDAATTSITIEAKNASKCRFYIAGMSMFK